MSGEDDTGCEGIEVEERPEQHERSTQTPANWGKRQSDDGRKQKKLEALGLDHKTAGLARVITIVGGPLVAILLTVIGYLGNHYLEGMDKHNDLQDHILMELSSGLGALKTQVELSNKSVEDARSVRIKQIDDLQLGQASLGVSVREINTELNGHESRLKCLEAKVRCP